MAAELQSRVPKCRMTFAAARNILKRESPGSPSNYPKLDRGVGSPVKMSTQKSIRVEWDPTLRSNVTNERAAISVASVAVLGLSARPFYRARMTAYYSNDSAIIEGVHLRTMEKTRENERKGGTTKRSIRDALIIVGSPFRGSGCEITSNPSYFWTEY